VRTHPNRDTAVGDAIERPLTGAQALRSDLGWSVLVGALMGLSPHTSATRPLYSLIGGVLSTIAVFAYLRWLRWRRNLRGAPQRERPPALAIGAAGWLCIGACALLFVPTLRWLWSEYTTSVWRNGHGIFLPLIVYGLARRRLARAGSVAVANSAWGVPLLAVAALLAYVESVTNVGFAGSLGIVFAAPGLSLLVLGSEVTRVIAFPLALCVFLIPVPESLVDPLALPTVSAILAEPMLRALDVPVLRDQTALVLPISSFGVSANCSGLSTFYSAVLASLVLGEFAESWRKRALLLLLAWPITVVVNAFRVTFLVGSANTMGFDWFMSPVHGMSGIAAFWITMIVVAAVGFRETRRLVPT